MSDTGIEEIEHTADWAICVHAETLEGLFERAAQGMFDLIGSTGAKSEPTFRTVTIQSPDIEILLVSWLEELLYILETENLMLTTTRVQIPSAMQLLATIGLLPVNQKRKEIKAVTFNDLKVIQTSKGFEVSIVFDV